MAERKFMETGKTFSLLYPKNVFNKIRNEITSSPSTIASWSPLDHWSHCMFLTVPTCIYKIIYLPLSILLVCNPIYIQSKTKKLSSQKLSLSLVMRYVYDQVVISAFFTSLQLLIRVRLTDFQRSTISQIFLAIS